MKSIYFMIIQTETFIIILLLHTQYYHLLVTEIDDSHFRMQRKSSMPIPLRREGDRIVVRQKMSDRILINTTGHMKKSLHAYNSVRHEIRRRLSYCPPPGWSYETHRPATWRTVEPGIFLCTSSTLPRLSSTKSNGPWGPGPRSKRREMTSALVVVQE